MCIYHNAIRLVIQTTVSYMESSEGYHWHLEGIGSWFLQKSCDKPIVHYLSNTKQQTDEVSD